MYYTASGMSYEESCTFLDSLEMFRIKLGLAAMQRLLAALGCPEQRLKFVHIAGTNGKGSCGATLMNILARAGLKAGFYSSPHLVSVRERFAINGELITESEFAAHISALRALFDRIGLTPTWFECATLLALTWFSAQKVDVAIMETGLGGRLDATNVIVPQVSVITDISRDHEQYLGPDIQSIAAEKAGIIKPGVAVVCSGRTGESAQVIEAFCTQRKSPLYLLGRDFFAREKSSGFFDYRGISGANWQNLPLSLIGSHQVINASLAVAALETLAPTFSLSEDVVRCGLAQVRWPGRMEYLEVSFGGESRLLLFEGAHNEAGVQALCANLAAENKRLILVWGNMADKNMDAARRRLFSRASAIFLTRAEEKRSARPEDLWQGLSESERAKCQKIELAEEALQAAMACATADDVVCVTGSLYLVGRLRAVAAPGAVNL